MFRNHPLILAALLISLGLLSACQSNKSVVGEFFNLDTDLKINFIVDADINPDEVGTASPLFVRMYQLKSPAMMNKADFIDMFEQDKTTLGADMIGDVHKLQRFKPGEDREEHFVLDSKTQYVGLYAEFLNFKDSKFKLLVPVVTNNIFRNSAVIRISGNGIALIE